MLLDAIHSDSLVPGKDGAVQVVGDPENPAVATLLPFANEQGVVLFRNAVKQALRRAGYHASFMCRPPFPNIMSSGWHLHQSLEDARTGRNVFCRETPADGASPVDAGYTLSPTGEHYDLAAVIREHLDSQAQHPVHPPTLLRREPGVSSGGLGPLAFAGAHDGVVARRPDGGG